MIPLCKSGLGMSASLYGIIPNCVFGFFETEFVLARLPSSASAQAFCLSIVRSCEELLVLMYLCRVVITVARVKQYDSSEPGKKRHFQELSLVTQGSPLRLIYVSYHPYHGL